MTEMVEPLVHYKNLPVGDLEARVARRCLHCDTVLPSHGSRDFCCSGCQSVYNLIYSLDLGKFYHDVKSNPIASMADLSDHSINYQLFDHSPFQQNFCQPDPDNKDWLQASLQLDHLTCYACVMLIQKAMGRLLPLVRCQINLSESTLVATFDPQLIKLSDICQTLHQLGYPPAPLGQISTTKKLQADQIRLGVGFFCLMNVMLLAWAEYLGNDLAGSAFFDIFRFAGLGFGLLALAFCGRPFLANFRLAWQARQLHLDIPIVLALILGFAQSSYHTFLGFGPVYYDSLVGIMFFLLLGRYVSDRALQHHQSRNWQSNQRQTLFSQRFTADHQLEFVEIRQIKNGDTLQILPGSMVPCQGICQNDSVSYDLSFLTGEPVVRQARPGQTIAAGAIIHNSPLKIKAIEDGVDSIILQLDHQAQNLLADQGRLQLLSSIMAKGLVIFVIAISILVFLCNLGDLDQATSRALATLIIACPCAFGLGVPLATARAFNLGIHHGVIFRSQEALEALAIVRQAYFDKTGTLTQPHPTLTWHQSSQSLASRGTILACLWHLDKFSLHHICQGLSAWARSESGDSMIELPDLPRKFRETLGQGISFLYHDHHIAIGRTPASQGRTIMTVDGQEVATIELDEHLKETATTTLANITRLGVECWILSGDRFDRVQSTGLRLGLASDHLKSDLTPQQKHQFIADNTSAHIMVGNGLNDSLALAKATVSIAVHDAPDQAKSCAGLLLLGENLNAVAAAIQIARSYRRRLVVCLTGALSFNLVGIALAASGSLSPLITAVIMPLNSLVMIALTSRWEVKT